MGLMDTRKPGLSNGGANQDGYPTSGETSANAGALPAQRAQAPYEQNRTQTNMPEPTARPPVGGGTLNGGAVQGAQYKTQAQNMSPGVASFVSIPKGISAQPAGFTAPQPSVPGATKMQMQQQPQYFAAPQPSGQSQQQQQAAPVSSAQPNQTMPTAKPGANMVLAPDQPAQTNNYGNQPAPSTETKNETQTQPSPTVDPANYDYLAEMQKMGQYYDIGGQYDLNQRSIEAEKARQQNMQAWAQNQMSGRGSSAGQAQQNYLNTLAELQSDSARAQLAQGAHQTELSNRLAFNQKIADEKVRLVELADKLNIPIDEIDFNKIAYENVNAYYAGRQVSDIDSIKSMEKGAKGDERAVPDKVEEYAKNISSILNKNAWNAEENLIAAFQKMSKAEVIEFYKTNKELINKSLATTWGSDNDKIRQVFYDAGITDVGD